MQVQIIKSKTIPGFVPEFTGVFDAAKKIVKVNGVIKGSYQVGRSLHVIFRLLPVSDGDAFVAHPRISYSQGFAPTLLRNLVSGATYFMVFEYLRNKSANARGCTVAELPFMETFTFGGIAGIFYWAPYYPIDVIKSTLQGDSYIQGNRKYKGFVDAGRQIYAQFGIKGFYRGLVPCMARSFPANAVLLLTVCLCVCVCVCLCVCVSVCW
jgi:hypothetical protein